MFFVSELDIPKIAATYADVMLIENLLGLLKHR
jgi:hypothetical protein